MTEKNVWIRADGNREIATGHLMRTLSIALALRDMGACVTYILADNESELVLDALTAPRGLSFDRIVLGCSYKDPEAELMALNLLLEKQVSGMETPFAVWPDFYFVDSYFLNESYFTELRLLFRGYGKDTKTGYLDDLLTFAPAVDLQVNYDICVPAEAFAKAGKVLQGPAYTPLRPEFADAALTTREVGNQILLLTGGTDPLNIAGRLAEKLLSETRLSGSADPDISVPEVTVISGALNSHYSALVQLAGRHPSLRVYSNVTEMAALMTCHDQAFTAAGTTLCELCAAGVPSLSFTMADNQIPMAKDFDEAGLIPYMGDVRYDIDAVLDAAADTLLARVHNPALRREISAKLTAAIDGKGAARIASAILELC